MHDEQANKAHEPALLQQSTESPASTQIRQDPTSDFVVRQPLQNQQINSSVNSQKSIQAGPSQNAKPVFQQAKPHLLNVQTESSPKAQINRESKTNTRSQYLDQIYGSIQQKALSITRDKSNLSVSTNFIQYMSNNIHGDEQANKGLLKSIEKSIQFDHEKKLKLRVKRVRDRSILNMLDIPKDEIEKAPDTKKVQIPAYMPLVHDYR